MSPRERLTLRLDGTSNFVSVELVVPSVNGL
jgi:hypothetical protein